MTSIPDMDVKLTVRKMSYYALVPVDEDGTPLHNGEKMTEIRPGEWVTPLAAMAMAMFDQMPPEAHP